MSDTELPTMPSELEAMVRPMLPTAPSRAFPVTWQGDRVWIKHTVTPKDKGWHRLQRLAAKLLGLPILTPTVSQGGDAAQSYEAKRLIELQRKGIDVPGVVGVCPGFMALSDLGEPLQDLLDREENRDVRRSVMVEGAKALAALHAKGEWHGSGVVRDLVKTERGIGFIDFEEDAASAMPVSAAQARDLILFLMSAMRYAKQDQDLAAALAETYRQSAPNEVIGEVKKLLRPARVLVALLKPFRNKLGRDALQAVLVVEALDGL